VYKRSGILSEKLKCCESKLFVNLFVYQATILVLQFSTLVVLYAYSSVYDNLRQCRIPKYFLKYPAETKSMAIWILLIPLILALEQELYI